MDNPKTYLITGASSGIGYETALKLAQEPFTTVIALARSTDKLQQLMQQSGGKIIIKTFDLEQEDPMVIADFLHSSGIKSLNGIIHNAGFLVNRAFGEISKEELEQSYRVNVFAPFRLTQVLLPLLTAAKGAHILHISSVGGVQGSVKFAGLSAYSSSKGALSVLTECLALELAPASIKVNCLALGAVQTEMLNAAFPGYEAPLKAHEMADFVSWFLLNGHRFFNGKILPVALSTP
ncbi:MAG: SDR family oxidoreductase [Bacteroidetes bacterium]|nr:SDR family oxidoreductase [Bacteroidota bacterium]MBK9401669.1 SDR family oxidoreductase [Bacteroidota bacterium]